MYHVFILGQSAVKYCVIQFLISIFELFLNFGFVFKLQFQIVLAFE